MAKRQDPKRMEALLAQRARRGWSWSELSRRTGHPPWKLQWWSRRLRRSREESQTRKGFVSVDVVDRAAASALELITRSGDRVSVPAGFDQQELVRLLQVLDRRC